MFSTVDQIGGFIYTIILSHAIGAEGLGMYQIANTLTSLIVAISASGLPFILGRRIAEFDAIGDTQNQNSALTAGLFIGTSLSAILCAFFVANKPLLVTLTNSNQIAVMCLLLLPAAFANSLYACFRGALWGKKKYTQHSSLEIIDITTRILLALIVFNGLFSEFEGGVRASLAYSTTCVLTATISFFMYKFCGGGFAKPFGHICPIIKSGIPLSGIRLAGNLFTAMVAFLFNTRMADAGYLPNAIMADYGILTGMVLPLIAFPVIFTSAISTTLVPEISGNLKTSNLDVVRRHLKKAIDYTLFFGGLAIGVYIAFAPEICTIIFGNEKAGFYVRNACWIMVPLGVASLTTSLQNSLGLEYKSLFNYFAGSVCMVFSLWFLPKYTGPNCLVIGTGIGMTVTSLLNVQIICKAIDLKGSFFKTLVAIFSFAGLSGMIGLFLSNLCEEVMGGTFALILCCAVCVAIYLILTTTFDTAEINGLIGKIETSLFDTKKQSRHK